MSLINEFQADINYIINEFISLDRDGELMPAEVIGEYTGVNSCLGYLVGALIRSCEKEKKDEYYENICAEIEKNVVERSILLLGTNDGRYNK